MHNMKLYVYFPLKLQFVIFLQNVGEENKMLTKLIFSSYCMSATISTKDPIYSKVMYVPQVREIRPCGETSTKYEITTATRLLFTARHLNVKNLILHWKRNLVIFEIKWIFHNTHNRGGWRALLVSCRKIGQTDESYNENIKTFKNISKMYALKTFFIVFFFILLES